MRPPPTSAQLARCARSNTARPLHGGALKISPCGVGLQRNGRGCCTSAGLVSYMRCGLHFRRARFVHTGAAPHRKAIRVSHLRIFPFLEWDSIVSDILSDRPERMSAKKGSAAARFRPKLITVSANGPQLAPSGRSDTASRLHAETVPSFPLRGRPPTERAGSCTNVRLIAMRCELHFRCRRFSHTDAGIHRDTYLSLHALRSFVSPRCGSLVLTNNPMQERTHIR